MEMQSQYDGNQLSGGVWRRMTLEQGSIPEHKKKYNSRSVPMKSQTIIERAAY